MSDVLLLLEGHMDESLPNECVGLLLEDFNIVKLRNQASSPKRFFVNPTQLLEKYDELTSEVAALYHSHPQRAGVPSGEDERMMLYLKTVWDNAYHIILSPEGHRAYHVVNNSIQERELPWHQP